MQKKCRLSASRGAGAAELRAYPSHVWSAHCRVAFQSTGAAMRMLKCRDQLCVEHRQRTRAAGFQQTSRQEHHQHQLLVVQRFQIHSSANFERHRKCSV